MNQKPNHADSIGVFIDEEGNSTFFRITKENIQSAIDKEIRNNSKRVLVIDGEPVYTGNALMSDVVDRVRSIKNTAVNYDTLPYFVN